jgi:hypothetical protein
MFLPLYFQPIPLFVCYMIVICHYNLHSVIWPFVSKGRQSDKMQTKIKLAEGALTNKMVNCNKPVTNAND